MRSIHWYPSHLQYALGYPFTPRTQSGGRRRPEPTPGLNQAAPSLPPTQTDSPTTPHTVHALSTECSKPRENSVQSAQLQLLHSVRSAQECTEDLSALSAECFWRSVFQAKCTVHGSRPVVRTSINVVQTREFRLGGGSKRCLNDSERQWQVIMAKTNHFRRCLTFRQGAVLYS